MDIGNDTLLKRTPPPQSELQPAVIVNTDHRSVHCQVCQNLLSIEGKTNQFVVKCNSCNEATPIKAPPPGKRYIRCPCKCLLICKATATRVACPRPDCRLVVPISGSSPNVTGEVFSDSLERSGDGDTQHLTVRCTRCGLSYFVTTKVGKSLGKTRCPQCHQVSSVGPNYARKRCRIFAAFAFILLCTAIATTAGTFELVHNKNWLYGLWGVLYLFVLILAIRCIQFMFMPISIVELSGPAIA